jgi:hypothetical protein
LADGVYIVRVLDPTGLSLAQARLLIQH